MGQLFHIVAACQGIDDIGDAGFFLQNQLSIARNSGGILGRQRNCLIQRVGVQRLRPAQHRRHRLIGGANDVVVGILFLQGHAGGLAMGPQHGGFRVLGLKFRHDAMPEQAGGAQLGRLHEKVHADGKEERQSPGKLVHVHAPLNRGADIFPTVRQGKGKFLHQVRAGLLHVIAGDRDGIEFRHLV